MTQKEGVWLEWEAVGRPFKKKDNQLFMTILLILVLIGIILIFLKQFSFLAALFSVFFVYWVLNTVEPRRLKYKVDERGVWVGDELFEWGRLGNFWCEEKDGYHLCFIQARGRVFGVIILTTPEKAVLEKLKAVLGRKLSASQPPRGVIERILNWVNSKIDLENY